MGERGEGAGGSRLHEASRQRFAEATHQAKTQPQRAVFERAVPLRALDVDRPHRVTVSLEVVHDHRGRVEAHGL